MAFILYGVHMTTASFFQGIGKPTKSLLIPLIRQGVLLIPLAMVMSRLIGLDGALLAAPVADTDVVTILINENVYQKCSILSMMLHFYDTLVRDN